MKRSQQNLGLIEDVESLLKETVIEEATQKVMSSMTVAIGKLSPEFQLLLDGHFEGKSNSQLADELGVSTTDISVMLRSAKNELINQIKIGFRTRQ